MGGRVVYKSSIDGEFVTEEYAREHPDTTFAETVTEVPAEHATAAPTEEQA